MNKNLHHQILLLLKNADTLSGQELAEKFAISRTAVWKHIKKLQEEGYIIKAETKNGYSLVSVPDRLYPHEISCGLNLKTIARDIHYFSEIDSTNIFAHSIAMQNANDGTIVVAEKQLCGKGRLGRKWLDEPYKNILISVILRPDIQPSKAFALTMLTSVAIAKAIKLQTELDTKIKWPNDIYVNNKKLCGILTELNAEPDMLHYAITGIGINVNSRPDRHPQLKDIAASILSETGRPYNRIELLKSILTEIENQYNIFRSEGIKKVQNYWNENSYILGKKVIIISGTDREEGIAEYITENGSLIIKSSNGKDKEILCGDVSLKTI